LILLTAENICKSYTEKTLLKDISLSLNEGEKIGLIGINGTGKSTFLKIIAGLESADSGTITRGKGVRVVYLPQNPDFEDNITVLEQVLKGISADIKDVKEFEAKSILTKLGITEFDKNVCLLSGGQKKRVAIASALVNPAEILILDEPTNHIDNDMVDFLEKYLSKYPGVILMVTHDRYFLDKVTNKIVEIENGNLYSYQANYLKFLELKSERIEMQKGSERKRQTLLRKELEWMQRGPRARSTKSRSRIERFEELNDVKAPTEKSKLELSSIGSRLGKKIIEINAISKSYENNHLIKNFSYMVLRGDRIGIIGANGCGKSTFLKIISGIIKPDKGSIDIGDTIKLSYFSQECEEMDSSIRVIDYIKNVAEIIKTIDGTITASQMLEKFLFPPDLQWNTIGRLSGGEKRRLYLLRILMNEPNILLLDEPTNDLDIETLSILEDYLESFAGAVIVVSHDRYFLDKVVDRIFAFENNGEIKQYLGGYSDYLDKRENIEDIKINIALKKQNKNDYKNIIDKPKKLKFSFNEQKEYNEIDKVIADLEEQLSLIKKEIEQKASNYELLQKLIIKKEELEINIENKTERWVYLNELAEKIENS
jgi:ATP-binding cassette subfamily F protein uup